MTDTQTPDDKLESQDPRRMYFTLVTAQVVFVANGDVQMVTRSTFGNSPSPNIPARMLLQIQNTIVHQVATETNRSGNKFDKALDVIVLSIAPLGHMTQEEFWAGMGQEPERVQLDAAPPAVQDTEGADTTNVVTLRPADSNDTNQA